jgi:cytochrome c-type biogenesis protein
MAKAIGWVRTHYVWVMRIGGGMLVLVGILLVTGLWTDFTVWLRVQVPGFETVL